MIREVGERPAGVWLVRDSACSRIWVIRGDELIGWFTGVQVIDWDAYRRGALVLERPAAQVER